MFNRKLIVLLAAVALLFMSFAVTTKTASALPANQTTLDSISVSCSSVTFTFTTNVEAPYIHGAIYSYGTNTILANGLFTMSGTGTHTYTFDFAEQPAETMLLVTFHVENSGAGYPTIVYGQYKCGSAFAGPGIPEGWTLHWMSCSSAVFDAPGGQPVGNDAVWAGQSFYVNPETQLDASGKSWSQVFVSSVISPWIPTSCVK